jgi:flagellar M-ring protein FliF
MTEFAQKVNYQRALQGEITRTILSLAEIESARVHLAFPEEGLFKRDKARAKASITLALRRGQALRAEQVAGIQRLVAAAVPGVALQDVTIVDQRGVALTRATADDGQADPAHRLDLKRDIEQHLARKATQVLERAFGAGQALASVDVTLDMNQMRVTTEDVTAPKAGPGEVATGVMVRERETSRDEGREAAAGSAHREAEYQVGRRVEQVVSQPGSIVRLQVLAVLTAPLDAARLEQAKALLGAAVGASRERGDTIVVQAIDAAGVRSEHDGVLVAPVAPAPAGREVKPELALRDEVSIAGMLIALLAIVATSGGWLRLRREKAGSSARGLDARQRAAALAQIKAWIEAGRTGDSATEARR